ncbi:alpha-mannosidase [Jatrophihabitans sp. YIM 134969]
MHQDPRLTTDRLHRTLQRLTDAWWVERVPLEVARYDVPEREVDGRPVVGEPVDVRQALAADYRPMAVGEAWGPPWSTSWFRVTGAVPPSHAGRRLEVVLDIGFDPSRTGFHAEGLVYRPDGSPVKGLHPQSRWIAVDDDAVGFTFFVEAAANPLLLGGGGFDFTPSPLGDLLTAGLAPQYALRQAELAVVDEPVWELVQDLEVLGQLAAELPDVDARRFEILRAVDAACDVLDVTAVDGPSRTAAAARAALAPALAVPARASAHRISAVGHAHIDSAWLWPTRETIRKVARTTSNVVDLLDHDDDLVYAMSSAQQFAWIEEHRPEVFTRVRDAVASGRFVPVGGMWVESDTNMPGGEALARQFVHGKRYFLDRFGLDTEEVWLPDSFGYTAALPQLVALSGSRWFLTQKISWNQTNRFPHHTFRWEGLDGTQVFTHFPPSDTYNSEVSGAELARAARQFAEKGHATTSLLPFGWGDGGGGPTREMLARARRTADLDGSPAVTVQPARAFFEAAEAEYPDAPVWVGELYLEFHRGTYTSQAKTKQGNRRSEHLLREAELWATTAAVRNGHDYPYDALDRVWKTVLLQQFHDILPGSSIHWVHREAAANYAAVAGELETIVGEALADLAGDGTVALTFNPTPDPRDGVEPFAAGVAITGPGAAVGPVEDGWLLDNGSLRVRVDADGVIRSVVDVAHGDREVIPPGGAGNLFQLHHDTPNVFDAWDVDRFYRNTVVDLVEASGIEEVPGGLRVTRYFGDSSLVSTITLPPDVARVDVVTEVDWHEREKLLKATFDVDVTAERYAGEVQFGHVFRPTHTNTSWDAAMFETCAHRWVHVGEPADVDAPGYGAAVVNDSTYGHDVTRQSRPAEAGGGTATRIRLSLLRAPQSPDPETDQGRHTLRYALVPGATIGTAVREGYRINLPVRSVPGALTVEPLLRVDGTGVVVEAVKLAEDRGGDVVVRLYESRGRRATATVTPTFPAAAVDTVDLLERPRDEPGFAAGPGGTATITLRPFQIVTLRFRRG